MYLSARSKLNVVLVFVVASLAALVYFRPGRRAPVIEQAPLLFPMADVADIRVAQGSGPAYEIKRGTDGWKLGAPLGLPADAYLIKDVLGEIVSARSTRRYPLVAADLPKYGLDKPALRLWINGTEYDFGATEPVENDHYVKDGSYVDLVGGLLYYRLDHDIYWWADKHLLPATSHITGLELPHATLMQDKGGKWQLYPAEPRVTADMLQRLVDDWQAAQAVGVTAVGKGRPDGEVDISLAGRSEPLRFQILQDDAFFVLARPDLGLQYELDDSARYTLIKPIVVSAAPPVTRAAPASHPRPAHRKAPVIHPKPAVTAPPATSAVPATTAPAPTAATAGH